MEAVFEALNFNFWTFAEQIINLLLVVGILYLIIYKPVLKMVADREEHIESALTNAEKANQEAQQTLREYESKLKTAREEAQAIVEKAAKQAEIERQQIVFQAREEAAKTLERAKEEISGEKNKALSQIREEVASLVVMAAGKVLDKNISLEDQEKLVKDFVSEVGRLQ